MESQHYQSLVKSVNRGIFDKEPFGAYLKDAIARATYLKSPIRADESISAFRLGQEEFKDVFDAFLKRAMVRGKGSPLDKLVCVDYDTEVVFAQNHPTKEKKIELVTFTDTRQDGTPYRGILNIGQLDVSQHEVGGEYLTASRVSAALIFDEHSETVQDLEALACVAQDIANSTNILIMHLAYMERNGFITRAGEILQ